MRFLPGMIEAGNRVRPVRRYAEDRRFHCSMRYLSFGSFKTGTAMRGSPPRTMTGSDSGIA